MTRTIRLLLVGLAAALSIAQLAYAGPAEPAVPTDIKVEAGHKLYLIGHAEGVQIHRCDAVAGGYKWNFVAPRAVLYDDEGRFLTSHGAGPHWQAKDGSIVFAQLDKPVIVDPTAIAWLRLKATSATAGPDGDRLAGTTFIQRINTTGGLAPAAATCNADTTGTTQEIPYTADYAFWKASGN